MPDELIMRGQTASGGHETLNFGGRTPGYGYQIINFEVYGTTGLGDNNFELFAALSAGATISTDDAVNPNFNSAGLIGNVTWSSTFTAAYTGDGPVTVINDLFIITQDLLLVVIDTDGGNPVNWQCRFKKVKLSSSAEAVANFNQFTIYDG